MLRWALSIVGSLRLSSCLSFRHQVLLTLQNLLRSTLLYGGTFARSLAGCVRFKPISFRVLILRYNKNS